MLNPRSKSQVLDYFVEHCEELFGVPDLRIEVVERLRAASVDLESDLLIRAAWRGKPCSLLVEVKPARYLAEIAEAALLLQRAQDDHADAVGVLVAPHLSDEQQRRCRSLGLNYVDLSGNAWVDAGSFLLDRSGRANKFKTPRRAKDVFSDKASLVLRALLEAPGRPAGIREIAERVAVSPGWVSQIVSRLDEMGYARSASDGVRVHNAEDLLRDWVSVYSHEKNESAEFYLSFRSLEEGLEALRQRIEAAPDLPPHALSLQAGAALVKPHAVVPQIHLYVFGDQPGQRPSREDLERFAGPLGLLGVAERGNVHVMAPYYAHGARYGIRELHRHPVVSDIQLFLDLYHYPVRGREQAEHLLEHVLGPRLMHAAGEDFS